MGGQYRDMWVGVYNPSPTAVTAQVIFEASPTQRWSRSITVAPWSRDAVPAQDVVTDLGPTRGVNFGTRVTFPPGQGAVVSFVLWHDANYARTVPVDLTPTYLCQPATP